MPRIPPKPLLEHTPLAPYLDALGALGVEADTWLVKERDGADATIRVHGPRGTVEWACERRARLDRATLGALLQRMHEMRGRFQRTLLLTEHVTPPIADELRAHGIAFVDQAGNAFLRDEGLYIWVTRRPRKRTAPITRRALHAAGLKLVFVLLRQQAHVRTLREFAAEAGIALGGVARILRELERRGWTRKLRDGVELHDPEAMLKRWEEGYAETLRPKLFLGACRRRPGTTLEDLPRAIANTRAPQKIAIGGELGAALLTGRLQPTTAALHLDGLEPIEVMRELQLLPDPHGDVFLLRAWGRPPREGAKGPTDAAFADPLLVHGELLLHPDDRLRDVARVVKAEHITPRWK
ncbi:MAG: hypothetical protein HZA53_05595 [Planctomycetes bacterium]|nr:hypothetical protein [Planctomycetota bacterium]